MNSAILWVGQPNVIGIVFFWWWIFAHGLNPFMPCLMAGTRIIKGGINGLNPWADKEKKHKN